MKFEQNALKLHKFALKSHFNMHEHLTLYFQ